MKPDAAFSEAKAIDVLTAIRGGLRPTAVSQLDHKAVQPALPVQYG